MQLANRPQMYGSDYANISQMNFPGDQMMLHGMYVYGSNYNHPDHMINAANNHQNYCQNKFTYCNNADIQTGEMYPGALAKVKGFD